MFLPGKRVHGHCAGGSIGSELLRQLPGSTRHCWSWWNDDSNLFYVDKDLRIAHPGLDTMPSLATSTREADVSRVFQAPTGHVFPLPPRYKHVPDS